MSPSSNSNLGAWIADLGRPDPSAAPQVRLDDVDRLAIDNAVGFAAEHARRYVATGGVDDGWRGPRPILILYTTGRRSGRLRRNPVLFVDHDGVRHVIASLGGADSHPQWYLNLVAEPRVSVRVGDEVHAAVARTLDPDERQRFWPILVDRYPMFADYQAATDRRIPVVALDGVDHTDG